MSFSSHVLSSADVPVRLSFHIASGGIAGSVRCLWWPPRIGGTPSKILVFTCGNPGLPEFYIPFLNIIRDRLHDETVAICAHGHIGHAHDLPQPKSDDSLSLHAQIEAAAAVFRNLQREYPKTPFLLLGHSIGAHIALNTASRYSMSVRLVLALQPTLSHLATTPNGRVLKHVFVKPWLTILAWIGAILVNAFPFLLPILFRIWPREPLLVLKNFVASPYATRAAMTMAGDELRLLKELDTTLLSQVGSKLRIVYSESGDNWVGTNSDEVIGTLGGPASNVKFAPVPHAFCIGHNVEAAEACLPWIEEALQ